MSVLPCQGCKGLCCGPVAITEKELKKIRKRVKSMPGKLRNELEQQTRYFGTCIFYDMEKDRCGIYSARPKVCQQFGYHKELVCFKNPGLAVDGQPLEHKTIGILSVDYTWNDFK
ncbi:hypothetical protein SAMN04488137_3174 [Fictibacillus solisalsi]|uniref:Zinc-or iron-chelating domain-containing protein n=1 Tax=Fictibacillus solisalsi TaxID=459525 RepID=A0A1G9Y326_9BACL|nr:YkgJ family cysteine cluster protein [Fictibacillus solisalsi]SDN03430.1 hypothetical protein SAMN04488137_3174 [Fictibacillus solisalsi]